MEKVKTIYQITMTEEEVANVAEALEIARTVCRMETDGIGICGTANANELMRLRDEFAKLIGIAFLTYQDLGYERISSLIADVIERTNPDL